MKILIDANEVWDEPTVTFGTYHGVWICYQNGENEIR